MPQIELKNVNFHYEDGVPIIKNISLCIEKGEYVAIVGRNGSGKSTLSKLFNGLLLPQSGSVAVCGFCSSDKKALFEIRKRVGMVFQNPDNQLVASIVEDDLAFGPENLGIKRQEIKERIDFALNAVGMQEYRRVSPERLSGGQKQRIAIAGALTLKPEILVLDESTSMLDPLGRKEVLSTAEALNAQYTTLITITHYMDEVLKANRVIVLDGGMIVLEGTPKEIFTYHVGELKSLGLELPISAQIAEKLREKGINLKTDILTKEELAEELCKL